MRSPKDLHPYQLSAIKFIIDNPRAMLWLEMSLGKTVISLTAASYLLRNLYSFGVIVFAPKRVVLSVWRQEAEEWSHTSHIRFALIRGSERTRLAALHSKADIYLANYELAPWLINALAAYFIQRNKRPPFDTAIFDEISRCKNIEGQRASLLYALMPFCQRRIGLTGTPGSNGYIDLYGQYRMLDDGARLFTTRERFNETFTRTTDYEGRNRVLVSGAEDTIHSRIKDMTFCMRSKDAVALPKIIDNNLFIELPPKLQAQYDTLEKEMFAAFDDNKVITILNKATLSSKCRQFANGRMYTSEGRKEIIQIHDLKIDVLEEVMEEAGGKPVLVPYVFRSDLIRLTEKYGNRKDVIFDYLGPGKSDKESEITIKKWNNGELTLLSMHPASGGHGLNLQKGSNLIAHLGLDWNLEYYEQIIARLARQGQKEDHVINNRILCKNTAEMIVLLALKLKAETQNRMKDLQSSATTEFIKTDDTELINKAISEYRLSRDI